MEDATGSGDETLSGEFMKSSECLFSLICRLPQRLYARLQTHELQTEDHYKGKSVKCGLGVGRCGCFSTWADQTELG